MKKYLFAVLFILVFLMVMIPLASTSPDGLEKVAQTLGIQEPQVFWAGLMSGYSVGIAGNPYGSTLFAGIAGVMLVLLFSLLLGKVLTRKATPAHKEN